MAILAGIVGTFLIGLIVWEGFETIILPRSVTRALRITRGFYRLLWPFSANIARRLPDGRRDLFLSYFGPLSLPLLLVLWACGLIFGFALLQWAQPEGLARVPGMNRFGTALYQGGVTFLTLGYGDVTPRTNIARFLCVTEAGIGFGFLAVVIGYLPVLYQAFSRREAIISLLDARASSPPSATEMLKRHSESHQMASLIPLMQDWEKWASEQLESHLSYPVLTYYRSQHDHQSWLGAVTAILDTCSLILVGTAGDPEWQDELQWQARMTMAMSRHMLVDLAYVFNLPPKPFDPDRLPLDDLAVLRRTLAQSGLPLCDGPEDDEKLTELRALYEPYVHAMADFLLFSLPDWLPAPDTPDNWQTSAWDHDAKHF
ncbi:MAG: potassium channel family protein [Janthinobacterium lividum]